MKIVRPKTLLLVTLNAVVGVACMVWAIYRVQTDPTSPSASELPGLSHPFVITREAPKTNASEDHPLFNRTRTAIPDKPAIEAIALPSQPPPVLIGIVQDSDSQAGVVLENAQTGARKYVRLGGVFEDWNVTSVRTQKAVIRRGSQEIELTLSFEMRPSGTMPDNASNTPRNP